MKGWHPSSSNPIFNDLEYLRVRKALDALPIRYVRGSLAAFPV